ncbi:MAG: ABC transporter permease [Nitrospirota bacterium]|jgi:Cu-processing system permease protein
MQSSTSIVLAIARKELTDRLRNRWVWTVSALLCVAALAIAFFGAAPVGVAGGKGGGAAIASLMNLAAYLVPLIAMILGCGAIIDEKQRGTLDLILVQPLAPGAYFAGTFLGFALALGIAVGSGLAIAGMVAGLWLDVAVGEYLLLIVLALLLGGAFLAVSFLVSLLARERGRAIASSIFVWLFAVFVFDLLLVGLLIVSAGKVPAALFGALLLANPADVFRLLCFHWVGSAASPVGLASVVESGMSAGLLFGMLVVWIVLPLALSFLLFRRRITHDTLV